MPAVTSHAKTHPQFPVLAVTGRRKACEDNIIAFPTLPEEILVLLLFYCKQINQWEWEWTFWAYFWRTLGVLEREFFVLKSGAQKVQVIMARCGPNLQTSRVLFSFLKWTNYFFGTEMERKNINRCLGGLKMEDQHELSPQPFLVNNFPSFNHGKNKTIAAL